MTIPDSQADSSRLKEAIVPSPFAEFVAIAPLEGVCQHLADTVRLVLQYSMLEIGNEKRADVVMAMNVQLPPLEFHSRLEPQATVTSAWRNAGAFATSRFFAAIDLLLPQIEPDWGREQIRILLKLLSEAGLIAPPATAFLAQARLRYEFERSGEPIALASLMAIVPNDAGSIFSMLERLKADAMLDTRAAQAAVRKIGKWDPGNLERSLAFFGDELFQSGDDADSVQFFLADLVERAGTTPVMLAISGIDPGASPQLIAAAFGGSAPPFQIVIELDGASSDQKPLRAFISDGERIVSQMQLGEAARQPEWLLKVRLASRATPIIRIAGNIPAMPSFNDDEELIIVDAIEMGAAPAGTEFPSLAEQLAHQLNVRIIA